MESGDPTIRDAGKGGKATFVPSQEEQELLKISQESALKGEGVWKMKYFPPSVLKVFFTFIRTLTAPLHGDDPRASFNNFYAKRANSKEDPEHMNLIDGLLSGEKKLSQLAKKKEVCHQFHQLNRL